MQRRIFAIFCKLSLIADQCAAHVARTAWQQCCSKFALCAKSPQRFLCRILLLIPCKLACRVLRSGSAKIHFIEVAVGTNTPIAKSLCWGGPSRNFRQNQTKSVLHSRPLRVHVKIHEFYNIKHLSRICGLKKKHSI